METIQLFKVFMSDTAGEEVAKVLNSGYIGQGSKVEEFEKNLRDHFNHEYVLTLNSGTSALHLAIHLLRTPQKSVVHYDGIASYDSYWPGLEAGDEVLATPMTCTASNWPILANGLQVS